MSELIKGWRIDKHIPVAIILTLLVQTGGIVWWAARLDARVFMLESTSGNGVVVVDRVTRMEEKVSFLKESTLRIEDKLERVLSIKHR